MQTSFHSVVLLLSTFIGIEKVHFAALQVKFDAVYLSNGCPYSSPCCRDLDFLTYVSYIN